MAILAACMAAQTPLEFAIVQDLVGGTPPISVFSIKTRNIDGLNTLEIAARAGIQFNCTRHSMLTDSMTLSEVLIDGQVSYSASILKPVVEQFFSIIRENMNSQGSGGISQIKMDLITSDEMGWVSVMVPISRVDSLISGQISHLDFWAVTPVLEVEVGTMNCPVTNESPLPELHGVAGESFTGVFVPESRNQAWKSLILPGWGQMSTDTGLPLINILAEIGGIALLFTDDYSAAGIGVLSLNHLISFSDLL
jgi:hypothetical protein